MSELDKLERYLSENKYNYKRFDSDDSELFQRHQIVVYDDKGEYIWDAICHRGSYGYEKGLLEIMGIIVHEKEDGDSVVGWLTAQNVIDRMVVRV